MLLFGGASNSLWLMHFISCKLFNGVTAFISNKLFIVVTVSTRKFNAWRAIFFRIEQFVMKVKGAFTKQSG